MPGAAIIPYIREAARRFVGANHANVAVIFAIACVPIISSVGLAIDYSRANSARSSMQAALDSTALMLSKDLSQGVITASQVNAQAQLYFAALYTNKDAAQSATISATYTANGSMGSTIQIIGSGSVMTDFMKVAGFPNIDFSTSSTSAWGNVRMRVAMALDNTGSMGQDGKMPALQTASKNLIDQLSALAKNPGDVYVSIIPFAKDVNVGPSNYSQNWIDWTAWDAKNGTNVCNSRDRWGNCTSTTWTPAAHSTWNGCVWDRDKDHDPSGFDTLNTAPVTSNIYTLFPAEQWSACPVQLMPLSYNWSALKSLIDTMTPNGNTDQAIGMAWAWQSLAQTAPLNAPAKDSNYTYKDAIILLSDGLNTQDRWYTDAASIDLRQQKLCKNAKDAGVIVYTIQVNTSKPADPTSAVLSQCASSPENFYMLTSANQVLSAFTSIGTSLSKLRVAQ